MMSIRISSKLDIILSSAPYQNSLNRQALSLVAISRKQLIYTKKMKWLWNYLNSKRFSSNEQPLHFLSFKFSVLVYGVLMNTGTILYLRLQCWLCLNARWWSNNYVTWQKYVIWAIRLEWFYVIDLENGFNWRLMNFSLVISFLLLQTQVRVPKFC